MTKKPSNILVNLLAAGGLDSVKSGLITCTHDALRRLADRSRQAWICNNCAMAACRLDKYLTSIWTLPSKKLLADNAISLICRDWHKPNQP